MKDLIAALLLLAGLAAFVALAFFMTPPGLIVLAWLLFA